MVVSTHHLLHALPLLGSIVRLGGLAMVTLLLSAMPVFAQGGGASQTGTINGKVSDTSGATLPGVTVTASSPSLMGVQTTVTNDQGSYRFPAVPPGVYTLTYELSGFTTVRREGVSISLGFTATIPVEMSLATMMEAIEVTAATPLIDVSATRVQQNFKLDQLQSIPSARDMWALLSVSPAVVMSRIDVGGNRAGTQTGYTAYGYSGQVRVLVEGINTTEGTGAAGFYFDYGSFEEAFLGTAGQGAEMPNPGVQSQFLGKSGGNRLQGEVYYDYENNSFQTANISDELIAAGIKEHSNEIQGYHDFNLNFGGPLKRDKLWYYFSWRDQANQVAQPNFKFDKTFDTKLWNLSGKGSYQANSTNKFIGYYQYGYKEQPNRLPGTTSTYNFTTPDDTLAQTSGSWIWKGEWNGTVGNNLYVESRYGDFGYYFPLVANSDGNYYWRDSGQAAVSGGDQKQQIDRDRRQFTTAATWFKDNFLGGTHSIKFGGELLLETSWEGYLQRRAGHIEHIFNNGVAQSVVLDFPTATEVGKNGIHDSLLSVAKMDQVDFFVNDTYSKGRLTLNLGLRYDRYKSYIPEQRQMAFTNGPVSIPDATIPGQTFLVWNSVVPRVGAVFNLDGQGKTVIKANYGLFRHNPGASFASSANPNQAVKTITYNWSDLNGDRHYQVGEETGVSASALAGSVTVDPNIKQPYTHEVSTFLERQIGSTLAGRVGFVYKTNDDLWQTYQPGRPISAYTMPFTFTDVGVDGVSGTGDDRVLTYLGVPRGQLNDFPVNSVIMNTPAFGRYKTIESSITKRPSNRWSMNAGFGFTWLHDFPVSAGSPYPNTPNGPFDENYTRWDIKVGGTYEGPWGIRVSPQLRHQAGPNFARTLLVTAPVSSGAFMGSTTLYAEPYDSRRQDNITVVDFKLEKVIPLSGTLRARVFMDVFNVTNALAAETISVATGSSFLRPTALLAPRVARLGFRINW
jgi:hypothetical protein